MNKWFMVATLAVGIAFGGASSSMASPITFDVDGGPDSFVNLSNVSTGLFGFGTNTSITATLADLGNVPDFTLGDGETASLDFFTFEVFGNGIGFFDLDANLSFTSPDVNIPGSGSGGWGTIFNGAFSGGLFIWDDPVQQFVLSDGNTVEVAFSNEIAIGFGNSETVTASITNLGGGTDPVPEPATMLLFGTGLAALVGSRIMRRKLNP